MDYYTLIFPTRSLDFKLPQLIVMERLTKQNEYLVIVDDPDSAFWVQESELLPNHKSLISEYQRYKFKLDKDMFIPSAIFANGSFKILQFRFPTKDIYYQTNDTNKIIHYQEQLISYTKSQQISEFNMFIVQELSKGNSLWTTSGDLFQILFGLHKQHKKQILVITSNYYKIASKLQLYGITSSNKYFSDADIIIQNNIIDGQQYDFVITDNHNIQSPSFNCSRLAIIDNIQPTSDILQFLKIQSSQQKNIHADRLFERNSILIAATQQSSGTNSKIFYLNLNLNEIIETKNIIQHHPLAIKIFGDTKNKKEINTVKEMISNNIQISDLLFSSIYNLKNNRKNLLDKLIFGIQQQLQSILIIVPDNCLSITKSYLEEKQLEIIQDIQYQQNKISLITDTQLLSYLFTLENHFFQLDNLPKFVIFPFTSTRMSEVYIESIYTLSNIKLPIIYHLLALNTLEEQLIVFKQQCSPIVLKEYDILNKKLQLQSFSGEGKQIYLQICKLLQTKGYQLEHETQPETYLNEQIPYELLLQASSLDLYQINKNFNIHLLSKLYFQAQDDEILNYSGLSYLKMEKSNQLEQQDCQNMLYTCNLNQNNNQSFYSQNIFQSTNVGYGEYYKKIFQIQEEAKYSSQMINQFLDTNYSLHPLSIQSYDTEQYVNNIQLYSYIPFQMIQGNNYEYIKQYQVKKDTNIRNDMQSLDLSYLFDQNQTSMDCLNFVLNKQLVVVSYNGGLIHNNLLIRGEKHIVDNQLLAYIINSIENNQDTFCTKDQSQKQRLIIALGLLDKIRPFTYSSIYQGYRSTDVLETNQAIIDYQIMDSLDINRNTFCIPLNIILQYSSSYELFLQLRKLDFSKQRISYSGNFFQSQINAVNYLQKQLSISELEFLTFMIKYTLQNNISSITNIYSTNQKILFYENIVKQYLEKGQNHLISQPVFQTKTIPCDNLLLFLLQSNCFVFNEDSIFNNIKIRQISLLNRDLKIQQLTSFNRFFLQIIRTISTSNKNSFDNNLQINDINKNKILNQLNDIQFAHKCIISGPKTLFIDQKFLNQDLIFKQIEITKEVENIQIVPKSPFKLQSVKQELNITTQNEDIQQLQIPNALSLPPQPSFLNQPLQVPNQSILKNIQLQKIPLVPTNQILLENKIARVNFFDQILRQADRNQLQHAIRRIISHYSCRSYYFKKNLLYVPDVRIISAQDALSHQLGQPVKDYEFSPQNQDNFDVLIQILTNDFQLQNKNRSPNIHKFCTVFNEEIKKRLETISMLPQLQLEFYSKHTIFSQWIVKRTLQAECDLNRRILVVFDQDPVMGVHLDKKHEWDQLNSKYKFSKFTDTIYNLTDHQAQLLYSKLKNECEQYEKEYRDRQLLMLIKIGIGTGSTPLETFYRFIQKDDPYKVSKTLTCFVNLLALCYEKKLDFPYKVPSVTSTPDELQQSLYRLEHMRFLHIKLQQFDFLQWLSRLSELKSSEISAQEKDHINNIIKRQMCCNITKLYPDYAQNLTHEEEAQVIQIGEIASQIDFFNQILWTVDLKFNEFLPENDPKYNMLRHFKLEKFAINDFDQSQVKKAWEIALQYKLLFISLFGVNRAVVNEILNKNDLDAIMLEHIFKQIQCIWSRLHDFILMHIITDMGYTEAMMQSIVGKDLRQKSKHVEFLRQGFFIDEEQFQIQNTPLYQIFIQVKTELPDQPHQVQFSKFPLHLALNLVQPLSTPREDQVQRAIALLRLRNPEEIFSFRAVSKELLTRRVERIAHALRCERILTCDPLQKYLQDKAVMLLPPNARIPVVLTHKREVKEEPVMKNWNANLNPVPAVPAVHAVPTSPVPIITMPSQMASRVIRNTKLSFFRENKDEIAQFAADLIGKSTNVGNIYRFLIQQTFSNPLSDWARLLTFLTQFQPSVSQKSTDVFAKLALKTGQLDSQQVIFNSKKHPELQQLFIITSIDEGYDVAYKYRENLIQGIHIKEMKAEIGQRLQQCMIFGQEIIFESINGNEEYEQKVSLMLYFMLSDDNTE